MLELGIDREELAKRTGYSANSIRNFFAPQGTNKSPRTFQRIAEVLEAEEVARKQAIYKPAPLTNTVTLTPTVAQFDRWMRAAYRNHDSFDEWAKEGLDALADEHASLRVASEETPYRVEKKSST